MDATEKIKPEEFWRVRKNVEKVHAETERREPT
jgi:hypothetical protein